jgi:hypothetical protein
VPVVAELDGQLDDAPDADGDQAGRANARHDLRPATKTPVSYQVYTA